MAVDLLGRRPTRRVGAAGAAARGGALRTPSHSPGDAPTHVLTALQQPRLHGGAGGGGGCRDAHRGLVPQLRLVHEQRLTAERGIDRLLARLATATPPKASRVSIVTSRFSSPCQGSEEW